MVLPRTPRGPQALFQEPTCKQMLYNMEESSGQILAEKFEFGHYSIHFDQRQLGQCVAKSTVLATDLPLRHWAGLSCTHGRGSHRVTLADTHSTSSGYPCTYTASNSVPPTRGQSLQPTLLCGRGDT